MNRTSIALALLVSFVLAGCESNIPVPKLPPQPPETPKPPPETPKPPQQTDADPILGLWSVDPHGYWPREGFFKPPVSPLPKDPPITIEFSEGDENDWVTVVFPPGFEPERFGPDGTTIFGTYIVIESESSILINWSHTDSSTDVWTYQMEDEDRMTLKGVNLLLVILHRMAADQ